MKINDFENSAHHTNALPVEQAAAASDSNSPAALPTVAPDALLCPTGHALNQHWLYHRIPSYAAVAAWHAFRKGLAGLQLRLELN